MTIGFAVCLVLYMMAYSNQNFDGKYQEFILVDVGC